MKCYKNWKKVLETKGLAHLLLREDLDDSFNLVGHPMPEAQVSAPRGGLHLCLSVWWFVLSLSISLSITVG